MGTRFAWIFSEYVESTRFCAHTGVKLNFFSALEKIKQENRITTSTSSSSSTSRISSRPACQTWDNETSTLPEVTVCPGFPIGHTTSSPVYTGWVDLKYLPSMAHTGKNNNSAHLLAYMKVQETCKTQAAHDFRTTLDKPERLTGMT